MVMGDMETYTDLLIIGSGPGGCSAAFRGADLGLDVTMVDSAPQPGGNYLHTNCIPSKTLLHMVETIADASTATELGLSFSPEKIDLNAIRTKRNQIVQSMANTLFKLTRKRNVQIIRGRARFENSSTVRLTGGEISRIRFNHAIIATGSHPSSQPGFPFATHNRIMSSSSALTLPDIPTSLLVVGGGATGLELGSLYARLGSRVTLAEQKKRLLIEVDHDLVLPLEKQLSMLFEDIVTDTRISIVQELETEVEVTLENNNHSKKCSFDRILIAIGQTPETDELGLKQTKVAVDDHGFILVDNCLRTTDKKIFAAGDVTGGPMLVHKAMREGKVAAEVIAGIKTAFDVQAVPVVIYTRPQICWCGLTEQQAATQTISCSIQKFPWKYSARAQTMGLTDGFTKLLIDSGDGRILGVGICGQKSENMIAEAALAIEMGVLAEDLALSLHPHPTLSETYPEAAELFVDGPTHTLPDR